MASPLAGRTLAMSGGSRGIGLAIGLAAARAGANVALLAKTDRPDPRLPGTIHTAAQALTEAGAEVLPVVGDVRRDEDVESFVAATVARFGALDLVVNVASAIRLAPSDSLAPKHFDLMFDINVRGTYQLTRLALPHLRRSGHAHVLSLSPPLVCDRRWLAGHSAYTASKMSMTMLTLGTALDEAAHGVAANCLWPRTLIATAAVQNLLGGDDAVARSRTAEIMADAAMIILERPPRECTGNTFIDDDVLAEAGVRDLSRYLASATPAALELDLFVDAWPDDPSGAGQRVAG